MRTGAAGRGREIRRAPEHRPRAARRRDGGTRLRPSFVDAPRRAWTGAGIAPELLLRLLTAHALDGVVSLQDPAGHRRGGLNAEAPPLDRRRNHDLGVRVGSEGDVPRLVLIRVTLRRPRLAGH